MPVIFSLPLDLCILALLLSGYMTGSLCILHTVMGFIIKTCERPIVDPVNYICLYWEAKCGTLVLGSYSLLYRGNRICLVVVWFWSPMYSDPGLDKVQYPWLTFLQ